MSYMKAGRKLNAGCKKQGGDTKQKTEAADGKKERTEALQKSEDKARPQQKPAAQRALRLRDLQQGRTSAWRYLFRSRCLNHWKGETIGSECAEAKRTAVAALPAQKFARSLENRNVLGLPALRSLHHVKLYGLAFLQAAEAIGLNRGVVNEYIFTVGAAQESKALRIVKPFHCSLFHNLILFLL
jgi:hypothetical protein